MKSKTSLVRQYRSSSMPAAIADQERAGVQGNALAKISASPKVAVQRAFNAQIQNSPLAMAQKKAMENVAGHSAATARLEADEELNGGPAQLEADEELKGSPAQLEADEELKGSPAQLEADEELKGSPAQLASEPQLNNTGLPDNLKTGIESLSGISMDGVTVHYNSSQPAQLNALAYAQGTNIHVGPGQEQHLPHEAWHVVQQAQGRVQQTTQMKEGVPINDDAGLEHEADVMGARAAQMISTPSADGSTDASINRNSDLGFGVAQRLVKFKDESNGTQRGYTNTSRFKNQLSPEQKTHYYDMHDRQNKEFEFANANEAHDHMLSSGTTDLPKVSNLARGNRDDRFYDVEGTEAFDATGASTYLQNTQPDMTNWRRFMQLHRNNALMLMPIDDEHNIDRTEIEQIYKDNLAHAEALDDHENSTALHLTEDSTLTDLTRDETELSEPLLVKSAVEAMYAVATKAKGELFSRGPGIVVPRFGGTNPGGMGLWAYIAFQKGDSFPEGSSASGSYTNLPWEAPLKKRRTPSGENVYIRGHLLNDHLGGPVASYNLVPLVGVDVPGAPNSNAAHSSLVEGQARAAFKEISKKNDVSLSPTNPTYGGLRYFVQASSFGGHDVSQITTTLKLGKLRARVWLSMGAHAKNLNKSMAAITLAEFKTFLGNGSVNLQEQQRYQKEWTGGAKPIFSTVWNTDNGDKPVEEVIALVDENISLWKWEAQNLPKSLNYSFVYTNILGQSIGDSAEFKSIPAGPVFNIAMTYRT